LKRAARAGALCMVLKKLAMVRDHEIPERRVGDPVADAETGVANDKTAPTGGRQSDEDVARQIPQ
jgi:hypothetical protein